MISETVADCMAIINGIAAATGLAMFKKNNPGCNCCAGTTDPICNICSGDTPAKLKAIVTGMAARTPLPVGSFCPSTRCTGINGTYLLDHEPLTTLAVPDSCQWMLFVTTDRDRVNWPTTVCETLQVVAGAVPFTTISGNRFDGQISLASAVQVFPATTRTWSKNDYNYFANTTNMSLIDCENLTTSLWPIMGILAAGGNPNIECDGTTSFMEIQST